MHRFNTKVNTKIAVIAWETKEARFVNMMLSPVHVLRVKVDKKVGINKERGGGE